MSKKISWNKHEFTICQHDTNWNDVAGIYIFCGINQHDQWVPLYIGQTNSFNDRLPTHEQWSPARKIWATHVHAKAVSQQNQRDSLERELIQDYQPRLNIQLK